MSGPKLQRLTQGLSEIYKTDTWWVHNWGWTQNRNRPQRWNTRRCFKTLKEGFFLFFFYFPGLFWWFITFLSSQEDLVFREGDQFNVHKKFWIDLYRQWSSLLCSEVSCLCVCGHSLPPWSLQGLEWAVRGLLLSGASHFWLQRPKPNVLGPSVTGSSAEVEVRVKLRYPQTLGPPPPLRPRTELDIGLPSQTYMIWLYYSCCHRFIKQFSRILLQ